MNNLNRNIKLLTLFNFFTDFRLYAPIAIIYFSHVTNSFALGASIFSFIMLTQALMEIPTGLFSDMIGRKKTMVFGALFSTLAITFYALGFNYWVLVIGAVAEGISRAFYSGNNNALLYDLLNEEGKGAEFHTYLGKLSSMFQWALAGSALLGSFVAGFSLSLVMWLSVVPQALCLVISFFVRETKSLVLKEGNPFRLLGQASKEFITNINLRLLSLSDIISYGSGEAGYQFQAAFFQTLWPVWAIGIAKTLSGIFAALSFHFSGKLINKFGAIRVLFFGSIITNIAGFSAILFPTVLSPLIISGTSLSYGNGSTAQETLLQKEFTDKQRATMGSLNSLAGSVFFAILVFFLGFLTDKIGPRNGLLLLSVFSIPILLLRWKLFKNASAK